MEPSAGLESTKLIERHFTTAGVDPFDLIEWTKRDVWAGTKYEHKAVRAPAFWSNNAVGITSKLYLSKSKITPESGVDDLVNRVAYTIGDHGFNHGYFGGDVEQCHVFRDELRHIMINQLAVFNSPVLFNVGRKDRKPQVSACFILGVDDTTESIKETSAREIDIFRGGSGSGFSVSRMRGSMEPLSGGGTSSGPVSFMRLWDAGAGTFKSGGTTRRAAKLIEMDADHPDIRDFITCKVREEDRLRQARDAGIDIGFSEDGERNVAEMTSFQNANNSVGVTDIFMNKALAVNESGNEREWPLYARSQSWRDQHGTDVVAYEDAGELLELIAESAHDAACPGMFYLDEINSMHTTPMLDGVVSPITSSNPCFPGETLVDTSEGRIRIDRLAEMYATGQPLPYALGFDRAAKLPAMKRIRQAIVTKMVDHLVEVTTDKGVVFRCTPDHKILTRIHGRSSEGDYVEAQNLVVGQRLRKIGHAVNVNRSGRGQINHRLTRAAPNGTSWRAPWMWEQVYGPIPEGMEVHHINEDATDDRLSNFELVDSGTHQSFHSTGERNGRFIDVDERVLVEFFESCELVYGAGEVSVSRWNRLVVDQGLKGVIPLANSQRGVRGMLWGDFKSWVDERRGAVNDTVKSVRHIRTHEATPVYDISVEDIHNFGVATEGVEHTIVVSNCGEYLSNDDTSCNLASINIAKFVRDDGSSFDVTGFRHVVDVMTVAMDILVDLAYFPDEKIADRSRKMRQLGLGYSNMGAAIMMQGLAYDSDAGRDFAASVTALETGRAYCKSAQMAQLKGAFHYFDENREAMLGVIEKHMNAVPQDLDRSNIWVSADLDWIDALKSGVEYGFRNAQASVVPPAGTTSYFLDCDTTGIEPAWELVVHKELAGGGSMTIANKSVDRALQALGYNQDAIVAIETFLADHGRMPFGGPDVPAHEALIAAGHEDVFHGAGDISPAGHIKMMAAVQPFVSGAISKTINMDESATAADVKAAYVLAWQLGCKDLAIYRNGSKARQVLSVKAKPKAEPEVAPNVKQFIQVHAESGYQGKEMIDISPIMSAQDVKDVVAAGQPGDGYDWIREAMAGGPQGVPQVSPPARVKLPKTVPTVRHKIHLRGQMADWEGYIHVGKYPDGRPAEVFISGFGRAGSSYANAIGAWAKTFSVSIQHGIDWRNLCRLELGLSDETGGVVVPDLPSLPGTPSEPMPIRSAKSIIDYIVRWIALEFGDADDHDEFMVRMPGKETPDFFNDVAAGEEITGSGYAVGGILTPEFKGFSKNGVERRKAAITQTCSSCGNQMRPTGGCFTCACGNSTGCG